MIYFFKIGDIAIKAPLFWNKKRNFASIILMPLGMAYAVLACLRRKYVRPTKVDSPVICVGNLVLGGAGKTPTTLALAALLSNRGRKPHILSRGYGAKVPTPTQVNTQHSFKQVGDEAILLSRVAPTWVFRNRVASAHAALKKGADILIMDDGFQNPYLHKDLSFIVVDGKQGFGNKHVFPAGPLREPIHCGLTRADAVILIGEDQHNLTSLIQQPIIKAHFECTNAEPSRVLAFAGLGFPDKFYGFLKDNGYEIVETSSFPDHHPYTVEEISLLIQKAKLHRARLITTEKDLVRIPEQFRQSILTLNIQLIFDDMELLDRILGKIDS